MIAVEDILAENPKLSHEDRNLIIKASEFAREAHVNQKRASGDPYYIHVFETAKILCQLGMPPKVIVAGLLHDTIEDTPVEPKDLQKEFGKDITFYVEAVTKLGAIRYHGFDMYINDLQKLFIATSRDLRVVIIKLADRLHNMRTLEFLPPTKQKKIAKETMDLYAPIASRLGIHKIKQEMEDLAFMYINPKASQEITTMIQAKSKTRILQKFIRSLQRHLVENGIRKYTIEHRIKTTYSTYKKMLDKKREFVEVQDIIAIRIIVKDIKTIYQTLGGIHTLWRPVDGGLKDYISIPKPNGYRSLHTRIFFGNHIIEIQIRTSEMDEIAKYGIAAHINYKEKKRKALSVVDWLSRLLPQKEETSVYKDDPTPPWIKLISEIYSDKIPEEVFMDDVRTDFLKERMFVFTPNHDVIDLPIEATVLDFAYAVHNDLGHYADGGYVNNKFSPLHKTLKNGDHVRIHKKKQAKVKRDYLEFVKTARARWSIKKFLRKQTKEKNC